MSIAILSYICIAVIALFIMSIVGIKTFHYPEFKNHGWKLCIEKVCFVIGTVIAVFLMSAFWVISIPVVFFSKAGE